MTRDRVWAVVLAVATAISSGTVLQQRSEVGQATLTGEVLVEALRGYDEALRECRARLGEQ